MSHLLAAPTAIQNVALGLLQLSTEPATEPAGSLPGIDMTRYALVCFGLVVVILVLGWGFKRFLAGNLSLRANKRAMKVVDMLPLGGKRQLAVVRCYDRTFLLGIGEREVNLVTELDAEEDVEGKLTEVAETPRSSFSRLFQRAVAEPGTAALASPTPPPAAAPSPSPPSMEVRVEAPRGQPHEGPSLGSGVLG